MTDKLEPVVQWGTKFRHEKTGGIYKVIAAGRIEATLEPCVVYQEDGTGLVWVRPQAEFNDGRFEDITSKST